MSGSLTFDFLLLQAAEEGFSHRVIPVVAPPAHAGQQGVVLAPSVKVISSVLSLVAIAAELAVVEDMHGLLRIAHISLAGCTVLSSWTFIQIMFSRRYAHGCHAAMSVQQACSFRRITNPTTPTSSILQLSLGRLGILQTFRLYQRPCGVSDLYTVFFLSIQHHCPGAAY
ncbi:MAG: DUF1345 domain-containing protein [Polaromonas sp.]|nr:DUF1345 domain-containing protein [Polaromonas sp.]